MPLRLYPLERVEVAGRLAWFYNQLVRPGFALSQGIDVQLPAPPQKAPAVREESSQIKKRKSKPVHFGRRITRRHQVVY